MTGEAGGFSNNRALEEYFFDRPDDKNPFLGGLVQLQGKLLTGLLRTPAPVKLLYKPVQGGDG